MHLNQNVQIFPFSVALCLPRSVPCIPLTNSCSNSETIIANRSIKSGNSGSGSNKNEKNSSKNFDLSMQQKMKAPRARAEKKVEKSVIWIYIRLSTFLVFILRNKKCVQIQFEHVELCVVFFLLVCRLDSSPSTARKCMYSAIGWMGQKTIDYTTLLLFAFCWSISIANAHTHLMRKSFRMKKVLLTGWIPLSNMSRMDYNISPRTANGDNFFPCPFYGRVRLYH